MVKPPYVAYVKPTGIKFIALDKQNKHKTIEVTQKIVGKILENPFVVFNCNSGSETNTETQL